MNFNNFLKITKLKNYFSENKYVRFCIQYTVVYEKTFWVSENFKHSFDSIKLIVIRAKWQCVLNNNNNNNTPYEELTTVTLNASKTLLESIDILVLQTLFHTVL